MNTNCRYFFIVIFLLPAFIALHATAQETDLDKLIQQETKQQQPATQQVRAFRSTRIANGHSVETLPAKILDIKVQHRFGYLSGGWGNFFGLDDATIRIGGDYGVTDRLMIGGGRASFEKQWDAFVKYKILQQQSGKKNIPVTLSLLVSGMIQTMPSPADLGEKLHFTDRLYYAGQLLIARKFGNSFSLQLMPTLVHYNIVPLTSYNNDLVSLGIATAIKISKRSDLIVEYYYNLPASKFDNTQNALSIGVDIETGGHVFQVMLTNASGIAERPFISESTGKFFDGDIRLGFNISRVFQLGKSRKFKG